MLLIVGLGNPGANYNNTRHNVGFIAVDAISYRYNFTWQHSSKFNCDLAKGECAELGKVMLCKPDTFMNLSGASVQPLASFYKIHPKEIIVIHDDIDVKLGKIKYKLGGGHAGHNGLKSIDSVVGKEYHRIRIGIGRPEHSEHEVSDFVLGKFMPAEQELIDISIQKILESVKYLASNQIDEFKKKILA